MKYILLIRAKRWLDKVNGNTYHSVQVSIFDKKGCAILFITKNFIYGYGNQFEETALSLIEESRPELAKEMHSGEFHGLWGLKDFVFKDITVWDVTRKKDLNF